MVRQAKAIAPTTTKPPSESALASLLGDAYQAFRALVEPGDGAVGEWRRYSKRSPWVMRVSQGKRPLFYARPDFGAVEVTVLLGGRAVEAALAGQVSKRLHAAIRKARVFPEGRPVCVIVKKMEDLAKVEELVAVKLQATGKSAKGESPARGGQTRGRS